MRGFGNTIGAAFAVVYLVTVAIAWGAFRTTGRGVFADIWLKVLTSPFSALGRLFSGSHRYEVRGDDLSSLLPAVVMLCCLTGDLPSHSLNFCGPMW